jgi:hypothetical protein
VNEPAGKSELPTLAFITDSNRGRIAENWPDSTVTATTGNSELPVKPFTYGMSGGKPTEHLFD